jgi:hypothetical protein
LSKHFAIWSVVRCHLPRSTISRSYVPEHHVSIALKMAEIQATGRTMPRDQKLTVYP